ncbi:PEP-CTERM sorting domain-containing protein [Aquincola sp. MAHUQ-54]|uniref:PEP-CTERM sorting domain-containing protein n=1 Tax=Aquincola agrisoli TaxID=3119538 RepID=A0AAW9QBB7_9BURK
MNTKHTMMALAIGAAFLTTGAQAAMLDFSGTTAGGPTFDRPLETLDFLPLIGEDARYNAFQFTVDTSGFYNFLSTVTGWDNFTLLYGPGFNAASPLTNALAANDDFGAPGQSGFSFGLTAGVAYTFVTTGFDGAVDFGAFNNSIAGPGSIAAVPEAGTLAMMAMGLALVGLLRRRR